MKSTVIEENNEIIISTPSRKSWVLIFIFSIIALQYSLNFIQEFFIQDEISSGFRLFIIITSLAMVWLAIRGLLWQLSGIHQIKIDAVNLTYSKPTLFGKNVKAYIVSGIKSFEIRDVSNERRLAKLQMLGILDKMEMKMIYEYKTKTILRGIEESELKEVKQLIEHYISSIHA
jgi:hypothetical protein